MFLQCGFCFLLWEKNPEKTLEVEDAHKIYPLKALNTIFKVIFSLYLKKKLCSHNWPAEKKLALLKGKKDDKKDVEVIFDIMLTPRPYIATKNHY